MVAAGGADAAASESELCQRFLNRARLYGLKHLRFDFDAERGEVLVAYQSHFADLFPPDIVLSVEVVSADQREQVAR